MYYLRTKPAAKPIQFTVDRASLLVQQNGVEQNGTHAVKEVEESEEDADQQAAALVCSLQNPGACDMCGS